MKHLRDVKHISCQGSFDKTILCRNGYFNLINGYKTPFIQYIDGDGLKHYIPNTSIGEIYFVKKFDENLRLLLLGAITKAEEEVRTFAAYKFDELNGGGTIHWYDTNAYSSKKSITDVVKTISMGYGEISRSKLSYVSHYLGQHHSIPTWVYFKVIRFSTFITTLTLCKDNVCSSLCNLYSMVKENGQPNFKLLINSLQFLRSVRNACAHNERLYDIHRKNGRIIEPILLSLRPVYRRNRTQRLLDCLIYLKYYLDPNDFDSLVDQFYVLITDLSHNISLPAFDKVRSQIGFKKIDDIKCLKNTRMFKKYNNF